MSKWLNTMQPLGALLMRLALGVSMAVHGYQKVVPHGALHHYAYATIPALGLPYWLGYVSAFTELAGGSLLIIGLLTRLAAALVAINMLVAFFTIGIHQGFGIYNYILALAALAIMLLFYGAGALGLDRKFGLS
jgi:putative oxidoreductase